MARFAINRGVYGKFFHFFTCFLLLLRELAKNLAINRGVYGKVCAINRGVYGKAKNCHFSKQLVELLYSMQRSPQ